MIDVSTSPTSLDPSSSATVPGRSATIDYRSFYGDLYRMDVWVGDHVAFLVPDGTATDAGVMSNLLDALDAGYETYMTITGREPVATDRFTFEGRNTIAVVNATCGAGCGYLGQNGIEILPDYFGADLTGDFPWIRGVYDAMADGAILDILFYEFGRNFWFYGDQLGDYGFTTGYAVATRYIAGEATGLPWDSTANEPTYYRTALPVIAETYFADPDATGLTTLALDQGIANPSGYTGAADLAASFFRLLHEHTETGGYSAFWQTLATAPSVTSAEESFANFSWAAEQANSLDWSWLFKDGWRFQVGGSDGETLWSGRDPALPVAVLGFGGDDILCGARGTDALYGDTGNDLLRAAGGHDQMAGGTGDDSLMGGRGDDTALGGAGDDVTCGGWGSDILFGGGDEDLQVGGCGADALAGGAGCDTLAGGAGDDILVGGTATFRREGGAIIADSVAGDGEADQFCFAAMSGSGNDIILDFEVCNDILRFRHNGIAAATQVGDDVLLETSRGGTVLVVDVQLCDLARCIRGADIFEL